MRILILFDLPSISSKEKKAYRHFRNFIMDDGFEMMQLSVYTRFCRNAVDAQKHIARILLIAPADGNVRIITVTEKQYEDMILVIGHKSETEKAINKDFLTVIE